MPDNELRRIADLLATSATAIDETDKLDAYNDVRDVLCAVFRRANRRAADETLAHLLNYIHAALGQPPE